MVQSFSNESSTDSADGKLTLQQQFGQIDIYVFDQMLRGNIAPGMKILDAGCGYGRNLVYLLRNGFDISALDQSSDCVEHIRNLSRALNTGLPDKNFQVGPIENMHYPDALADVVICNSVLHFARDDQHFHAMLTELWRVLRPGGMLFCRLGSRIGMDFKAVGQSLYQIGDGSIWYLVDEAHLMSLTNHLQATLVDPLKTTVVQGHRCMTTWVLRKRS